MKKVFIIKFSDDLAYIEEVDSKDLKGDEKVYKDIIEALIKVSQLNA